MTWAIRERTRRIAAKAAGIYRTYRRMQAMNAVMPEIPAMVTFMVRPCSLIEDDLEEKIKNLIEEAKSSGLGKRD